MVRHQRRNWAHCLTGQRHAAEKWQHVITRPFNSLHYSHHILCFGAILLLFVGCSKEAQIVEEIRSIKTITVGETTSGQLRIFSGVVRAADRTGLSFEVPGNVLRVNVDIGDTVKKGDVLAELDKEPYVLNVQKAEADLVTSNAKVKKQQSEYERQVRLLEQGAGVQRRVEQAEFALKEAVASVDFTRSALDLAKRDLRKAVLYAPFDGSIGVRDVEPFVDVHRGQKLFEVDAKGEQEIVVNIPETVVNLLSVETPVDVDFPTLPNTTTQGRITEVSTLASEGSAFPVQVRLLDPPLNIRSGMTAEASFTLQGDGFAGGYPIPGPAIKPTAEANHGFVFVYQADTSMVKLTPVGWRGVKDNMVVISKGVSPGDVLAVAGVSFLTDGMKVKLMAKPEKAKPETLEID